jgi:hypothetical protein
VVRSVALGIVAEILCGAAQRLQRKARPGGEGPKD